MTSHDSAERRQPRSLGHSPIAVLADLPSLVLLERLPVPVLAVDDDAAIIFANRAFVEMLGYCQARFWSLTLHQILPTVSLSDSAVAAIHNRAGCIVDLFHADGSVVSARMSKSALLRREDPIALVAFDDLTEAIWTNPRLKPD